MFDATRWEEDLRHGHFRLSPAAAGGVQMELDGHRILSRFMPVMSRAHDHSVGHLAQCVMESDEHALPANEPRLLNHHGWVPALHMSNYLERSGKPGWLFLTLDAALVQQPQLWPPVPQELFSSRQYAPGDLVLVIPHDAASQETLGAFVEYHQALGFLVALDGFGHKAADLAKIFRVHPDLVLMPDKAWCAELAPAMPAAALPGLIDLLHEAGAMVGLTGVDSTDRLQQAIGVGSDLLAGWACNRSVQATVKPLESGFQGISDLSALLEKASSAIANGKSFESGCERLLNQPEVLRCYLLDATGTQRSDNLSPVGIRCDRRFWPLANARGACWAHREYFRLAQERPGQVTATRRYLSLPDGRHCQTLAIAMTPKDNDRFVLCCDIVPAAATPP